MFVFIQNSGHRSEIVYEYKFCNSECSSRKFIEKRMRPWIYLYLNTDKAYLNNIICVGNLRDKFQERA